MTLNAQTERVLNLIPTDWTDEAPLRRQIREVTMLTIPSIAQRLNHLRQLDRIERRWLPVGAGVPSQVRRVVPAVQP